MASPHITELSRIVYNSKVHRVQDIDPDWIKSETYSPADQPINEVGVPKAGSQWTEPRFSLELAGSGTAGTPPVSLDDILIAANMKYANVPVTSDTYSYDPDLASATGVTIDLYEGNGIKLSATSCKGNLRFMFRPNRPGRVFVEFAGLYVAMTEATDATAASGDPQADICKNLTATFGGDVLHLLEADVNLNVQTDSPNFDMSASATAGCRAPNVIGGIPTGSILAVFPDFSTANYWTEYLASNGLVLSAANSAAAGKVWTASGTFYLNDKPTLVRQAGKVMVRLSMRNGVQTGEPFKVVFT